MTTWRDFTWRAAMTVAVAVGVGMTCGGIASAQEGPTLRWGDSFSFSNHSPLLNEAFTCTVKLYNDEYSPVEAVVALEVQEPVRLRSASEQRITVPPRSSRDVGWSVYNAFEGEGGRVEATVKGASFKDSPVAAEWIEALPDLWYDRAGAAVFRQFRNHHPRRTIVAIVEIRGQPHARSVPPGGMVEKIWVGRSDTEQPRRDQGVPFEDLPWTARWADQAP